MHLTNAKMFKQYNYPSWKMCEHGDMGITIKKDSRVLVIEDVITTGKSSLECAKLIEITGATIAGYACIIDRSNGKSNIKEKIVSQIQLDIPTYTNDNLPKDLSLIDAIKPGSRNL